MGQFYMTKLVEWNGLDVRVVFRVSMCINAIKTVYVGFRVVHKFKLKTKEHQWFLDVTCTPNHGPSFRLYLMRGWHQLG